MLITGGILALLGLVILLGNVQHLRRASGWEDPLWNRDLDRSYAELAGHAVLILAAILLTTLMFLRQSAWAYGAWALVLVGLVLDDFLMLHERGGRIPRRIASAAGLTEPETSRFGRTTRMGS